MKKSILFFTSATAMLTIATVVSFETEVKARPNGISGMSGAMFTCQDCHGGISHIVDNGSTATLTSDIPAEGYTPGKVYNMALTIYSQKSKVGFNFRAQRGSGTDIVGSISNVSSNAQITTFQTFGAIPGELTHTSSNTITGGKKEITFQWTAPEAGTGDVNYFGVVATGINKRDAMDSLNKIRVVIKENTVTGIDDATTVVSKFVAYPTNPKDNLTLSYGLAAQAHVKIKIYDFNGRVADEIFEGSQSAGTHSRELSVGRLNEGSYMLTVSANGKIATQRIVVCK